MKIRPISTGTRLAAQRRCAAVPLLLGLAITLCSPLRAVAADGTARWVSPPVGDALRGNVLYEARCVACHSADAHRVGPAHRGVLGRRVGSAPGYAYSPELAASRLRWTAQTLNTWLADPESLVPGQRMGFQVEGVQDRADLIAFLATLK